MQTKILALVNGMSDLTVTPEAFAEFLQTTRAAGVMLYNPDYPQASAAYHAMMAADPDKGAMVIVAALEQCLEASEPMFKLPFSDYYSHHNGKTHQPVAQAYLNVHAAVRAALSTPADLSNSLGETNFWRQKPDVLVSNPYKHRQRHLAA